MTPPNPSQETQDRIFRDTSGKTIKSLNWLDPASNGLAILTLMFLILWLGTILGILLHYETMVIIGFLGQLLVCALLNAYIVRSLLSLEGSSHKGATNESNESSQTR